MKQPIAKNEGIFKNGNLQLIRKIQKALFGLTLLFLCLMVCSFSYGKDDIYPLISPYDIGLIEVGDGHKLYYEKSGNPFGEPVIVLHDGPGGRSNEAFRRFFNPEVYNIIQFDQRGCGRSVAESKFLNNTTDQIIHDINMVARELNLEKFVLTGIGWGATLATYYSQQHPAKVKGLILSGVNFCTSEEIDRYYEKFSAKAPDLYRSFIQSIGYEEKLVTSIPQLTFDKIKSGQGEAADLFRRLNSLVTEYGVSAETALRSTTLNEAEIKNYYLMNHCFLREGIIKSRMEEIAHIPTFIIIGDRDPIATVENSIFLHNAIPGSALDIVPNAYHNDYPIGIAIMKGSNWLSDQLMSEKHIFTKVF